MNTKTPTLEKERMVHQKQETQHASDPENNTLLPVFIKLEQLRLVMVGGGQIGTEKLTTVLQNAPQTHVSVVATFFSDEVLELSERYAHVQLLKKPYEADDLNNADLVMAAVNDLELAARIQADAKSRGLLINVADKPALCDFYLGSVVKKGPLKIAISTNGQSPTAAKRIKEVLNETLPKELESLINNLHKVRNQLSGDFTKKVKTLDQLTSSLVNEEKEKRWKKIATYSLAVFGLMLIGHFIFSYIPLETVGNGFSSLYHSLDANFGWMVLAGFLAQLVDGALGMGYGVTSTTLLLSTGTNVAAISGSIHTAEMFASGASGYSHYKFGNVNKKLFKALVIPGVLGAIIGAVLLSKLETNQADWVRPVLATYTFILGVRIFINAFRQQRKPKKFKKYGLLAGLGGFFDSFGGGGWGPIVTSTLISKGRSPRFVIGSVSLTEFFVTLASAFTFFTILGISHWQVILALIVGSLLAAPLAAKLVGKLPRKTSFILLSILVIIWSLRIIVKSI